MGDTCDTQSVNVTDLSCVCDIFDISLLAAVSQKITGIFSSLHKYFNIYFGQRILLKVQSNLLLFPFLFFIFHT